MTIIDVFTLLSVLVFARPPTQTCCTNANDCVAYGICVSSNSYYVSLDGDSDKDYCLNKRWYDCGSPGSTTGCQSGWECDSNHDCIVSCGGSGAGCGNDGDCCNNYYCSKRDPSDNTLTGFSRCCRSNILEWFDPAYMNCRGYSACSPECQSNPYSPNCLSGGNVYGCCSFQGGDTYQFVTTY